MTILRLFVHCVGDKVFTSLNSTMSNLETHFELQRNTIRLTETLPPGRAKQTAAPTAGGLSPPAVDAAL